MSRIEDISSNSKSLGYAMDRKYSVVEFLELMGLSVHVIPTVWLDEDTNGELTAWWPPTSWTDSKVNKAIKDCVPKDDTFTLHHNVRLLHSYNNYLIARNSCKTAEYSSHLDTESEELGLGKRRKIATIVSSSDEENESPKKRSKHASAPAFNKTLGEKIKVKLVSEDAKKKEKKLVHDSEPLKDKNGSKKSNDLAVPFTPNGKELVEMNYELDPFDHLDHHRPEEENSNSNSNSNLCRSLFPASGSDKSHSVKWGRTKVSTKPITEAEQLTLLSEEEKENSNLCRSPFPASGSDKSHSVKLGRTKVSTKPISEAEQLTLLSLQSEMRQSLERIERMVSSVLKALKPSQKIVMPKDLPTLPLRSLKEFETNEEYLSDKSNKTDTIDYLSRFVVVGVPVKDQVYSLLRKTMTDGLASQFNWKGTREKLAFSESSLSSVIIGLCYSFIVCLKTLFFLNFRILANNKNSFAFFL